MTPQVIITLDGPAGTGKSTVAHRLARRLGLEFLDTGAMYRAAALIALEQNIAPDDGEALGPAVREADLRFDWDGSPPEVLLGDRDVSARIREMDVSRIVSIVAAQPRVREVLVERQRAIAARHARLVTEGRDQGSVVFPDAPVKFFMHADEAVRADRRVRQLAKGGREVDERHVLEDIRRRDHLDSTRPDGPLLRPDDAIDVDTSTCSVDEVVTLLERLARSKLAELGIEL